MPLSEFAEPALHAVQDGAQKIAKIVRLGGNRKGAPTVSDGPKRS
jgi:hypothetical protein